MNRNIFIKINGRIIYANLMKSFQVCYCKKMFSTIKRGKNAQKQNKLFNYIINFKQQFMTFVFFLF